MALIQGGPPEWIWERTPDPLKWQIVSSPALDGHTVYELRVNCGLGIMRLQFFAEDEMQQLRVLLDERLGSQPGAVRFEGEQPPSPEPVQPDREPGINPEPEPGNVPDIPDAERPPRREAGIVYNPDFASTR